MKNDNRDFTIEVSKEASQKGHIKSIGDAVGLPDKEDKDRIRRFLIRYEEKHPGEIKFHRDAARERLKAQGQGKFAVIDESSRRRYLFELPVEVGQWLESVYPLMFTQKAHTAWFAKNFPELRIPESY